MNCWETSVQAGQPTSSLMSGLAKALAEVINAWAGQYEMANVALSTGTKEEGPCFANQAPKNFSTPHPSRQISWKDFERPWT